jgi:hypothetical protein
MPNIRIMNWNVEKLSRDKINTGNMAAALTEVIVRQRVDILFIAELAISDSDYILHILMATLNQRAVALGFGQPNDYTTAVMSSETGKERYGFILKDPAVTDPIFTAAIFPIKDMTTESFQSMSRLGLAAGTAAAPVILPHEFPLLSLHASPAPPLDRGRAEVPWPGLPPSQGGFSQGRGFRRLSLCMFRLPTSATTPVIAIVPCHYGADESIASAQVKMLRYLHISQIYGNINGSHIDLDGAAVRVEDLIFTGDFNLDFLRNPQDGRIARAYGTLTRQRAGDGTGATAAAAAPPAGVPAAALPLPTTSALPTNQINDLVLRAAVTNVGTILHPFSPPPAAAPPDLAALRSACLDNFFFGGTHLEPSFQMLPPPGHMPAVANADCGLVVDVPAMIKRMGDLTTVGFHVAAIAATLLPDTKNVHHAAELRVFHVAGAADLTAGERLIGARLLSDHLPVVVQLNIP